MAKFKKDKFNTLHRLPDRGTYDQETIYSIIDEALICQVGFVQDGCPVVIPTQHARQDDKLYIHGAKTSRLIIHAASGDPLCISFTLVDGIILARSVFNHSMQYRSVVVFGKGELIQTLSEKLVALKAISDHLLRQRWEDARQPNQKELDATAVVKISVESASAKINQGDPKDAAEDYALPFWAGVIPIRQIFQSPQPDPKLDSAIQFPGYLENIGRDREIQISDFYSCEKGNLDG